MDLRGFGVGRRTWHRELRYGPLDGLVIAAFVAFAVVTSLALGMTGNSQHYLLPFLRRRLSASSPRSWIGRWITLPLTSKSCGEGGLCGPGVPVR